MASLNEDVVTDQSTHSQVIKFIAEQSQTAVQYVNELYYLERQKLSAEAKIQDFLPVLAIRGVREALKQRASCMIDTA
jgi:hypothetical protein